MLQYKCGQEGTNGEEEVNGEEEQEKSSWRNIDANIETAYFCDQTPLVAIECWLVALNPAGSSAEVISSESMIRVAYRVRLGIAVKYSMCR